jgi:hypothetical protein
MDIQMMNFEKQQTLIKCGFDIERWSLWDFIGREVMINGLVCDTGVRKKKGPHKGMIQTLLLQDLTVSDNDITWIDHIWIDLTKRVAKHAQIGCRIKLRGYVTTYQRSNGIKSFRLKKYRCVNMI